MCDKTTTRSSNSATTITFNQGADISNGVGVSTGGMLIFNSLTGSSGAGATDLLEMLKYEEFETTFDNCQSYIDEDNYLSVRTLSPCTKNPPTSTAPGTNTMQTTQDLEENFRLNWIL